MTGNFSLGPAFDAIQHKSPSVIQRQLFQGRHQGTAQLLRTGMGIGPVYVR